MSRSLDRSLDEILAERKQVCGTFVTDPIDNLTADELFHRLAEVHVPLAETPTAMVVGAVKDRTIPAMVSERYVDYLTPSFPFPSASRSLVSAYLLPPL